MPIRSLERLAPKGWRNWDSCQKQMLRRKIRSLLCARHCFRLQRNPIVMRKPLSLRS